MQPASQPSTRISQRIEGADMRNEVRPGVPHSEGEARVIALHEHYCARTGFDLVLNLDRQRMWREWLQWCGGRWGADEISLVIAWLRPLIVQRERNEGALKFSNLIGRPDGFEEDLALARKARKPAASSHTKARSHEGGALAPQAPDDRTPAQRAASFREAVTTGNREPGTTQQPTP